MRHVPVAVAYRDGYDWPFKVEVVGEIQWTVPIVDDRRRLVGHLSRDGSGEAAGVTDWDAVPRRFEPRAAPAPERDQLARFGRMEAAVDEKGRVCLIRIRPR